VIVTDVGTPGSTGTTISLDPCTLKGLLPAAFTARIRKYNVCPLVTVVVYGNVSTEPVTVAAGEATESSGIGEVLA